MRISSAAGLKYAFAGLIDGFAGSIYAKNRSVLRENDLSTDVHKLFLARLYGVIYGLPKTEAAS